MIWLLAILGGCLGRAGGSEKGHTLWRDIGVSLCVVTTILLSLGFKISHIWAYGLIFGLSWGSFSTYWDWLFNGEDNLWFSGFMCGLSAIPLLWCGVALWVIIGRTVILSLIWGLLNKFMPRKLLLWRGDVANEFLRYFAVIITLIGV